MSVPYQMAFSVAVKDALKPQFEKPELWQASPQDSLTASARIGASCDYSLLSKHAYDMAIREFLCCFFSALPRNPDFGQIAGVARSFLRGLHNRGDVAGLIGVTNYIFKSLALTPPQGVPALVLERGARIALDLHYEANVLIRSLRTASPDYAVLPAYLDGALRARAIGALPWDVVAVFLTRRYFDGLRLWLKLYERHDPALDRLAVFVIDDGFENGCLEGVFSGGFLADRVLRLRPPAPLGTCGNGTDLNFLWYLKVHICGALLESGRRVTYSDLDAYWTGDYRSVRDAVAETSAADVILSPTHDMPLAAVLRWGFTPCAGFFSMDPTPGGRAFVRAWRLMTEIMFDDQIALAELLHRRAVEWIASPQPHLGAIADLLIGRDAGVRVAMLGDDTARRVGDPDPQTSRGTTIWHPRWQVTPDQLADVIHRLAEAPLPA